MKFLARSSNLLIFAALCTGCATLPGLVLAPGATQVRFTDNPADVSGCTAVGNISASDVNISDKRVAQNEAVGLNANVILNTGYGGVAYHCK